MKTNHLFYLTFALAVPLFPACTTTEITEYGPEGSPDALTHHYAGEAPAQGHIEAIPVADPNPTTANGTELQILLTSKFIELSDKSFDAHDVMNDPRYQMRIRKLAGMKGADLMTAPSVVTRNQQRAKIEVIRELPLKGGVYDEVVNLGVTLDVKPTLLADGRLHLSGKSTVRELDTAERKFDRHSTAIAVQSSDTFIDSVIKPGQTIQVICRDKGTPGQRIVFITAQLIDPSGQRVNVARR